MAVPMLWHALPWRRAALVVPALARDWSAGRRRAVALHELAHLRHFNHGLRFRAFYQQLLEYARAEGIYRPGRERRMPPARPEPSRVVARRREPEGPTQLTLF